MDIPLNLVNVTLADADPKLVFNQFTAACLDALDLHAGPGRRRHGSQPSRAYRGRRARRQALPTQGERRRVRGIERRSQFKLVGTPQIRVDAREIVTGRKVFAMERGDLVQPEVADLGR